MMDATTEGDRKHLTCEGSDDPAQRCGRHHPTENGNPWGGYDCCCGKPWNGKESKCMTGAKPGDRVDDTTEGLRERTAEALRQAIDYELVKGGVHATQELLDSLDDPESSALVAAALGPVSPVLERQQAEIERLRAQAKERGELAARRQAELIALRPEVERLRAELAGMRDLFEAANALVGTRADERDALKAAESETKALAARQERDAIKAAVERIRRGAQVWADMRPTQPTLSDHGHGVAWAGETILAALDAPETTAVVKDSLNTETPSDPDYATCPECGSEPTGRYPVAHKPSCSRMTIAPHLWPAPETPGDADA